MWVTQRGCEVRLAVEAFAKLRVTTDIAGKNFQGIATRQPRVLGQVHLAHPPGAKQSQDRVTGALGTAG